MPDSTEFRVALTVEDFDGALSFYRDALGLEQVADWSSDDGRVVLLAAGRAMLELFDEAQAKSIGRAGRRVAGPPACGGRARQRSGRSATRRGGRGADRQSR